MKYLLLIKDVKGETHLVTVEGSIEVSVAPGDDVVVMDENGQPVDVSLRPDEEDLLIEFPDGNSAILKDFYDFEDWSNPVTISLNPVEPHQQDYEFNAQSGNLPSVQGFTLMRFSSVNGIEFDENFDPISLGAIRSGSSGGDRSDPEIPNVAPNARDDEEETGQGQAITIDVLDNDLDANTGDQLIVRGVDQPAVGSASISSAGQIVFNPGTDFDYLGEGESATVSFNYSISDGNGGTDTATVTVTVNGEEDPTVTAPDAASTNEDSPVVIEVLANDNDPDAKDSPLNIASVTQPATGVVTNNGTNVTFDPNGQFDALAAGESATVTFTYTTDTGETDNVTVTVNGVNDGPDAIDDAATTGQDAPLTIDVLGNDTDTDTSDTLMVAAVTQPVRGSVTFTAGDVTFDPGSDFDDLDAGESATATFDYTISDGNGGTDIATVTVTVNGADDATVTASDVATTDEETSINIDVLANDSDVDTSDNPLNITSVTQPASGLVTNNSTNVTFDPNGEFESLAVGESTTVNFTYTTDTGVTENVTVTVNGVNDGPDAVDDIGTTNETDPVVIDALDNDTDPDGSDTLIISGVDQPSLGSVSVNADNELVFEPGNDFDNLDVGESATVTFDYTISDGNGGTNTATVTVTVTGQEDATVTAPDAATTNEETPINIDVLGNDSDVDASDNPLNIASVTQPGSGLVTNNGSDLTFDPNGQFEDLAAGESTTVTFTYTTDTGATENVTVTVNGVNDGPDAIDDVEATNQRVPLTIDVLDNDTDPDASDMLMVTGVTQPGLGSASFTGGNVTFDPGNDFDDLDVGESATVTFDYTISDGNGGMDTATVTVTVNGADDATVTAPDAAATDEETAINIDVLANDSDVDTSDNPLSVASVTQPASGLVTNSGTNVTFDPNGEFESLAVGETAVVNFTYTTDTGATENVAVTVNGVNDGPDAVDDAASTGQNSTVTIDVLDNDSDPDGTDSLIILGVNQPPKGQVQISGGNQLIYNPLNDFDDLGAGEDATVTFDYVIYDGNGGTDTATVTVTVNGADEPTVTAPDMGTTDEKTAINIDVLANDSDVDTSDNPLSITSVTQPAAGVVSNNGTNVSFDPNGEFESLDAGESAVVNFTYTTDTGVTENVSVTVNGADDATLTNPDADSTDEDSSVTIDVLANDSDVDTSDNPLFVSSVTQPLDGNDGTVVNNGGDVSFTPGPNFNSLAVGESATTSFTYTTDTGVTETVTVTVNGLNDGPTANPDADTTDQDSALTIDAKANDTDPDTSDVLTITNITQPGLGVVSINAGNQLVFDPNGEYDDLDAGESATATFGYTISDGNGGADTSTVTVTVTGRDDALVATADAATTDEDSTVSVSVLTNDYDVDTTDNPLSIDSFSQPGAGNGSVSQSGDALIFDPDGDFEDLAAGETAVTAFNYTVINQDGATAVETVTITVNGVNDAPTAVDDSESVSEDGIANIDLLGADDSVSADSDPEGDTLSISQVDGKTASGTVALTSGATLTLVGDGSANYDPNGVFDYLDAGETATDTFDYVISDGNGETDTATVTVTVSGQNDAPDTYEDTLHTMEGVGGSVDVIQNDSDPESTQMKVTEVNGTSVSATEAVPLSSGGFVAVMEDGRVYFNPNGAYSNLDFGETVVETFTYTVEDEGGASSVETVTVVIDGVDGEVQTPGAYQVLSNQLYEIQLDPTDESINYVPIGDPLPFDLNSIAFNANDNLIYANARDDGAALGVLKNDVIQINPFTGEVVGNLGQYTNDLGLTVPTYAGVINSDINVYYVNGGADSVGNTTYAIDLNTMVVTGIGDLPGADYGIDVNTGLIWSVNEMKSYSLDPTSGVTTTYTHGGLQEDGTTSAGGTYGSVFSDMDGNIQVTSNSGFGLYQLDVNTGGLTRIGDAPATSSNDATGTRTSALPSALPYLFLDVDGSTDAASEVDAFRMYDPAGAPVAIADSDVRIADLDGDTISSARVVLKNSFIGDTLGVSGGLPAGIVATTSSEGGYQVLTLSGDASQTDYEAAIAALTFSNSAPGSIPTDPREISITLTDVEGVEGNVATSYVFIGSGIGTIAARDGQSADQGMPDQIVLHEDDFDPTTGGATFNLIQNDSDDPANISSITQPPAGRGSVINNSNGTVTFQPGSDFQFLSEGETEVTTFTYTSSTGETENVTVTVHGADDPVEASPDSASTTVNSTVSIDVLANDRDVDAGEQPLTLTAVTQPALGAVSIVGGEAVFDPQTDFDDLGTGETATVTFIYTVTNADGVDENELVTVTVTGVNGAPDVQDDIVVSTTDIDPVTIDVVANDSDVDGTVDPTTVDLDLTTAGVQDTLIVANEGTWTADSTGKVTFTPDATIDDQPTAIQYSVADNEGATNIATIDLKYSAADVWFGNDESASVNSTDFNQSRVLISGAAAQMTFADGNLAFNAALFSWSGSSQQTMAIGVTNDETTFVNSSANYSRAYSNLTDIGAGIVYGAAQIQAHVANMQMNGDPRADVPQVMVILTDASESQIDGDTSLAADSAAAKAAGIVLVFVAIQEAVDGADTLETYASLDANNDPFVVTADTYADIDSGEIADLLNAIREAAAAGLLPPVVIDLDGDGVEFDDIDEGIAFDVDGDGELEQVAWADEDDAVLVYDANNNDQVDGINEVSFAQYSEDRGATDLEGLRHFDTNDDLVLDANDAEYDAFKLWQDRDGDGTVDDGEMMTLSEAGIESIGLTSDENAYYTAGGDVKVHGEGTVKYADGSEGKLADAEFQYEELTDETELHVVTENDDVMDVNDAGVAPEPVGEDLLEGSGEKSAPEEGNGFESGGAMPSSSGDDDAAAADAAMS